MYDPRFPIWTLSCFWIWILFATMPDTRTCCIPQCGATRQEKVNLHAFPNPSKETERFSAWKKAVGSTIANLSDEFITKNRKICSRHFEAKYLTWSQRLSYGAIPTINMPGLTNTGRILQDITNFGATTSQSSQTMKRASTSTEICDSKVIEESTMAASTANPASTKCAKKGHVINDKAALRQMLSKEIKKKESYACRLKKALKLSENLTFQNTIKKFTSLAAIFMGLQFREINKDKMGRRFTEEEKIMALSLYKYGPRLYRVLAKGFVLPSPLTLGRMITRAEIKAGINNKLFKVMKKKIKNLKPDDKLCVLIFDEISISPHFDYNQRKDSISGFVTDGITKKRIMADHALVFMIRGVLRNYKQPIAYTFCSGSTKKEELAVLVKEMIRKLRSIGLKVVATVCDQGSSNVSCINDLISQTKQKYLRKNEEHRRNTFEVDDEEVIPLYDPPHLIKGMRNNFLDKNLQFTLNGVTKTAKWEHIHLLHQENPSYSGIKLLTKLTDDHVNPEKCKMKVKFATQIFSEKVAANMGYLAENKILPDECKDTADLLLFFDKLFDSVNGSFNNSKTRTGKPLLQALKVNSMHNEIWEKSKVVLRSMKFIKNGKETSVPTLRNWMHTIENFEHLRDVLFEQHQIKSIWLRHFNQDPIENFFGAIRSHGVRNVNPTPAGFETAFVSLLISNLTGTHSPGSNCEKDDCLSMFKSMKQLFQNATENTSHDVVDMSYINEQIPFVDFNSKMNNKVVRAQLEYVTGYLLDEAKKKVFHNCADCKSLYDEKQGSVYLKYREYNNKKKNLTYASTNLINTFSKMQDIMMWALTNYSEIENIKMLCKTIMYIEVDTTIFQCQKHRNENIEFMFNLGCKFFLFNWCKDVNKILKGLSTTKDLVVGDQDIIKNQARDYIVKRRHFKNKK